MTTSIYGGGLTDNPALNMGATLGAGGANPISQFSSSLASKDPTNPAKSNAAYGAAATAAGNENTANQSAINGLGTAGTNYVGSVGTAAAANNTAQTANTNAYITGNAANTDRYTGGITDATNTAVNGTPGNPGTGLTGIASTADTGLGALSTQALGNAAGAETLQQLKDPTTNLWATNVSNAYNQQAQGIQNQGLADYGVLAALGGQATANTIGGAGLPITGGQMAALNNSNLSQAGGAFANAQGTANNLRTAGLQAGINQANTAYNYGQAAGTEAENDVTNQASVAQGLNQNILQDTTNELNQNYNATNTLQNQNYNASGTLNNSILNNANNVASATYGTTVGQTNAQLGENDNYYGTIGGLATDQAQAAQASSASNIGAVAGVTGQVAGGASQGASQKGGLLTTLAGGAALTDPTASGTAPAPSAAGPGTLNPAGNYVQAPGTAGAQQSYQPGASISGYSATPSNYVQPMPAGTAGGYSGYGGYQPYGYQDQQEAF